MRASETSIDVANKGPPDYDVGGLHGTAWHCIKFCPGTESLGIAAGDIEYLLTKRTSF
jgi:hypothetical protein